MGVPRQIQGYLAKGDFEALEDEWLRLVAEDPTDLDTYVSVARALAGTDEAERARFLLEMLDEELGDREQWPARLKLLRRAGHLLRDPEQEEELHPQILDTLEKIYGDRPSFGDLVAAVGLHRAPGDIPKTWDKVERFESLIVFDVGSVVEMENRGVGRVVEVNQELESFKVDFEGFRGLTVGFRAAAKLLRPLPGDHVLRRKLERPEELAELAEDDPRELLHQVLASYDRPLKAGEIRQVLSGVVEEERWSSWWTAARKHPQVVAKGSGGRQTYHWADSDADALETLWKAFTKAEPRRRIELLRRDGSRDLDLQKRMTENLAATAEGVWRDDAGLAFEIWFALERARGAPEGVPWAPEALLESVPSQELFAGIADRLLRERAYTMYRERKDDWPEVFQARMAREEDPRALDLLAEGLRRQEPDRFGRVVDDLMAQPQRAPAAFTWLAERAAVDEELRERNPLRLLIQILQALGQDELKPYRTRLSPLADSGGTLPRLLSHLTEDQAEQAEQAIQRAAAFEPYQRDQLVEALRLRFQGLTQDVVKEPLYATPGSIEAKREEFQVLVTKELPANRKAIEEARALGDLRENFEYKAARQRHEYLSARAAQLEGELARVQPIAEEIDPSQVRVGTEVELTTDGGTRTVTLLGPWESDPENDVISYLSDLGQALLGKQPGETVTVGTTSYTVGGISGRR